MARNARRRDADLNPTRLPVTQKNSLEKSRRDGIIKTVSFSYALHRRLLICVTETTRAVHMKNQFFFAVRIIFSF